MGAMTVKTEEVSSENLELMPLMIYVGKMSYKG